MKRGTYILFSSIVVILISVMLYRKDHGFTRMPGGLRYKIISIGDGPFVQPGQWLKLRIRQVCGDSVLVDPLKSPPQYQLFDSSQLSPESLEIFGQVSAEDSLVFLVHGDTALARKRPGIAKQCDELRTFIRVQKILLNRDSVQKDLEMERDKRMPLGDSTTIK